MMTLAQAVNNLVEATKELVEGVKFDDSGFMGKGGNGGLISSTTIRKADNARIALSTFEKVLRHERATRADRQIPQTDDGSDRQDS